MLEMWNPLRFWFKDFPLYKLWVASLEPWPGPSPILRSVRAPRVLRRSPTSSLPMAWRTRAPEPLRPMLPRPMGDVMWCPTWLVVPYHMLCWFMLVYVGLCWFMLVCSCGTQVSHSWLMFIAGCIVGCMCCPIMLYLPMPYLPTNPHQGAIWFS